MDALTLASIEELESSVWFFSSVAKRKACNTHGFWWYSPNVFKSQRVSVRRLAGSETYPVVWDTSLTTPPMTTSYASPSLCGAFQLF